MFNLLPMLIQLSENDKKELVKFSLHLATLYNNTMYAKSNDDMFMCSGDVLADLDELSKRLSEDGSTDYNLGDRVVRMFCGFAGIDTLSEAKEYIENIDKFFGIRDNKNCERIYNTLIESFAKDSKYDLIHFNHGLHGIHLSKRSYKSRMNRLLFKIDKKV